VEGYRLVERAPTVDEYRRLRDSAGWGAMTEEALAAGLPRGLFACVVLHEDAVVACGRVVGDGGMYFYVQDVIVLPEHQGRGLGDLVMGAVMGYLAGAARSGSFVGLMAASGVERFYARFGFRRRPDDRPGMFRVW
jgi:GNAT superfamily N-acetyltransferase